MKRQKCHCEGVKQPKQSGGTQCCLSATPDHNKSELTMTERDGFLHGQ